MITIYKTKHCPYCKQVALLLDRHKIPFTFYELDEDDRMREELIDKTGAMTVPITYDGTEYIVGWNPGKLMEMVRRQHAERSK